MALVKISPKWKETDSRMLAIDGEHYKPLLQVQDVYSRDLFPGFLGTTFQNPFTMSWEFIPVGTEVWYSSEEGELVAITR